MEWNEPSQFGLQKGLCVLFLLKLRLAMVFQIGKNNLTLLDSQLPRLSVLLPNWELNWFSSEFDISSLTFLASLRQLYF